MKKLLSLCLAICLMVGCLAFPAFAEDSTLTPNADGIYEISTADQLFLFAELVNGGESAVSPKMLGIIQGYGKTTRLAGANRFVTSVMVADRYFPEATSAVLAYTWDFPDGLCGGGLANAMGAPLILTMTRYESEAAEYMAAKGGFDYGVVLGGEGLISEGSVHLIFNLIAEE